MATDLGEKLMLACAVTPANRPEVEATPELEEGLKQQGLRIDELYIDRGYITSSLVEKVQEQGGEVLRKPWKSKNAELFPKFAFKLDMRRGGTRGAP